MDNGRGGPTRGVTLAEVVVALLVLSVGAVAMAGLTSAVARMVRQGVWSTTLAALLAGRLESLLADPCAAGGGAARTAEFTVRWTTTAAPGGVRISVSGAPLAAPTRVRMITRLVACGD